MVNNILANNQSPQNQDVFVTSFISNGYNTVYTPADSSGYVATDITGKDPLFSLLDISPFGTLPVMVPRLGSPALNKTPCTLFTDQRGFARPQPGKSFCDIGAVEITSADRDIIFRDGFGF